MWRLLFRKVQLIITSVALSLIRLYQYCVSPFLPSSCCFYPSCSEYAQIAFKNKPILVAVTLIVFRLLKCHPFSKGGYDPVPHQHSNGKSLDHSDP